MRSVILDTIRVLVVINLIKCRPIPYDSEQFKQKARLLSAEESVKTSSSHPLKSEPVSKTAFLFVIFE